MRYEQLGKTDLRVSRIGFGCWQLSPAFWGDIPLEPWQDAVEAAPDAGINFIDTADAYGKGYAERELGECLHRHGLRNRFVLATKFYWRFEADNERFPDTTHAHIMAACEASLRRLRTDVIDLYQIHAFDPLTRPEEVAAALLELRRQGKVRWFGASNLNVEQMDLYRRYLDIESLQPPYSLLNRGVEARELPYCQHHRIGVTAYSPLFRGLLSGKYERGRTFHDSRAHVPEFSGERFNRIMDALDRLRPMADGYGLTLAQLSVRWVLTHPALTCAIVGIKAREHIEGIAAAAEAPLAPDDWHRMAAALEQATAGAC